MPVAEFLTHFRAASLFLQPWKYDDGAPPTPEQLADARKYAHLWLTTDAVQGFDISGFYGLSADQRRDIEGLIEGFRAVAAQVPPGGQPTDEQVRQARERFLAIYRVVGKYLFHEVSQEVIPAIEHTLAEDWVPDFVVRYDCEVGTDSTGDPAVWVWLIVTDEATKDDRVFQSLGPLRNAIMQSLRARGVDSWVYLSVRTVSEQGELLADSVE